MTSWNYGNAHKRVEFKNNRLDFEEGSLFVHDIMNELPKEMFAADLIFVDPPWNLGNLNTFYTKADLPHTHRDYLVFHSRLLDCIFEIKPKIVYFEIGKENLAKTIMELKKNYRTVTFYNSKYYNKAENICYIVCATNARHKKRPLDYMDEEKVIEWVMANESYECAGDLCMGLGLVAVNALKNGKRFVGTELNHKRLAVCVERLLAQGAIFK